MKLTNTGDVKVAVRAKIEESWTSANGDDLNLHQLAISSIKENTLSNQYIVNYKCIPTIFYNGDSYMLRYSSSRFNTLEEVEEFKSTACEGHDIAFTNDNWYNNDEDGYFYYNYFVNSGDATSDLIDSITFNEDVTNDFSCTTSNGVESCTSTGDGYDGATYTLTVTFETVQYDKYQEYWDTDIEIIESHYYEVLTDSYNVEGWGQNKTIDLSNHNYTITNTSDTSVTIRAKIEKRWSSLNSNRDCEMDSDCEASLANIIIKTDNGNTIWEELGPIDYYEYYIELAPNESIDSLIDSITYEDTYGNNYSGESYSNDTLIINVTYEIVETGFEDYHWDTGIQNTDEASQMEPYTPSNPLLG